MVPGTSATVPVPYAVYPQELPVLLEDSVTSYSDLYEVTVAQ